jgi:anthranilate synthase component 2
MILVLDNYDSFTHNLIHYLEKETDEAIEVHRNDKISLSDVNKFDKILLSPGPGIPSEAGILLDVIRAFAPSKNILGVCLGQQAIAEAFGGSLKNLEEVCHGESTSMEIVKSDLLFENIPLKFNVGRYHSWVINEEDLPSCLEITARDLQGNIMAIRHSEYNVRGVQFHPESVLTEYGSDLIRNWANS